MEPIKGAGVSRTSERQNKRLRTKRHPERCFEVFNVSMIDRSILRGGAKFSKYIFHALSVLYLQSISSTTTLHKKHSLGVGYVNSLGGVQFVAPFFQSFFL